MRYLGFGLSILFLSQMVTQIVVTAATHNSSTVDAGMHLLVRKNKQTPTQFSSKTDFENESTDLIANVLYRKPSSLYNSMQPNGAYGINADWQRQQASKWYIESQQYGEQAIIGGLVKNDPQAIQGGFKIFDWGFAQQVDDGSFFMTGDRFHSTSFFVEAVAHALLVIQQSPHSKQYAFQVAKYKPLVHRAARWMISSKVWEQGIRHNRPYTHRRYLVATALGLTGKLTDDQELIQYAHKSIEDGLSLQRPDGVNPEKNGHDSSYQMVGVIYAQRWVMYFPQDTITPKVVAMINKSLLWEQTRILPSGEISTEGNTRTAGQEKGRSGKKVKGIDKKTALRGFAYWASVTGNQKWEESARQIAKFYYKMP
ncbi:hypothetical protein CK516_05335 [Nostoc sp. 'Peltigera malacea cyanobiont' DB3992]|nr:hypothetical protein CK516_05335 [Nostoc sp. 'Peltigera malacea cyanobiont' DB3992]